MSAVESNIHSKKFKNGFNIVLLRLSNRFPLYSVPAPVLFSLKSLHRSGPTPKGSVDRVFRYHSVKTILWTLQIYCGFRFLLLKRRILPWVLLVEQPCQPLSYWPRVNSYSGSWISLICYLIKMAFQFVFIRYYNRCIDFTQCLNNLSKF